MSQSQLNTIVWFTTGGGNGAVADLPQPAKALRISPRVE